MQAAGYNGARTVPKNEIDPFGLDVLKQGSLKHLLNSTTTIINTT